MFSIFSASSNKLCAICGATTNYAHYGIDACRACAEFYKRTITANKSYTCRQGHGQCTISRKDRFICRKCRFDKCKQLGMTVDFPRKRRKDEEESGSLGYSSESSPSSGLPSPLQESVLERVTREHSSSMARRKCAEVSIRPTSLRQHVRVPHKDENLVLGSWSFLMECMRVYAGEYFSLAAACFPEFSALMMNEKQILLKTCAVRIYLLEQHFVTAKLFPIGPPRICMLTQTTCLDRDNIKFFIKDSNPLIRHLDIVRSMTFYMNRLEKIVWPMLEKNEFTDIEFHALFGLIVWQIDPSQQLPESLIAAAEKIRQEIYSDLRKYYREELKLSDISVKMGNLMTIEHTIQEASSLMEEEIQTYNLLDMLQADVSFLQLVLRIML